MKLLERAIATVSPSWALSRARDSARLEVLRSGMERVRSYDGADRGRRTQGWLAPDSSPVSATRGALHELRSRARDLVRNNPWAISAVRDIVGGLVGEGIRPNFKHKSEEVEERVRKAWKAWADRPSCDAGGRSTHGAMQAAVAQSMIEGGQALIRRRFRRLEDELPCPLQLQALEGDYIDTAKDGVVDVNGNQVLQGKAYDAIGRLVGFWLFRQHPGDLLSFGRSAESVFVPAEGVLDVYREDRIGQVRGIPWAAPCIIRLRELDKYEDNEAVRMVVATAFSAFVKDMSPDAGFDEGVPAGAGKNEKGQPIEELEPGTVEFLPPGKDIVFPNVPQNEGYQAFVRAQLLGVAKGLGTTYEGLTGDFSGANFTTGRMAEIRFRRDLGRVRAHVIIPHVCEPTRRWFEEGLVLSGQATVGELEDLEVVWIPPRYEMIDPRTEVEATIAEVRAGFRSVTQVVHSLGQDAEQVLEELAKDLKTARGLDLFLSVDGQEQDDPGDIPTVNQAASSSKKTTQRQALGWLLQRAGDLDELLRAARASNGHS